jgi:hypothetical protein
MTGMPWRTARVIVEIALKPGNSTTIRVGPRVLAALLARIDELEAPVGASSDPRVCPCEVTEHQDECPSWGLPC